MPQKLEPTLTEALTGVCKKHPLEDCRAAVHYLADWLLHYNPNKVQPSSNFDDLPSEGWDSIPERLPPRGAKAVDKCIHQQL
jgi:hypothetical protein